MERKSYHELNAELNLFDANGQIQFYKDKEAAHNFFVNEDDGINSRTVFFHDLEEKVKYLVDNGHWDEDVVLRYGFDFLKSLFQYAHSFKHRFQTFLGAEKFYASYAMRTNNGEKFLERFEDRVVLTAIAHSTDRRHATRLVKHIIEGRFQPATPTFLNAGRAAAGGPTSCYLLRVDDNMESIARAQTDALQLSKRGGGVALSLSNIRESGAPIKGIEGLSSGVVPIMKILEDSFSYADQLGQRQGAGAVYLNIHHPDIVKFLDTKRENADEKIRIKTLSLGIVVPDITFELLKAGEDMYLFSPYDIKKHYGLDFTDFSMTDYYHTFANDDRITKQKISARKLFQTIAEIQFESGYPYLVFEDTVNYYNPAPNVGRISMSNLCVTGDTEILTSKGYRKVIDLYESQEDFEVVVDERARNFNLSATGTSVQKSTKMFKTAKDAEVYELVTNEGHRIKATAWHKFYVDRDGELVKIPLAEVEVGDKVLVQGEESASHGEVHLPDEAYLAGIISADGSFAVDDKGREAAKIYLYADKSQFREEAENAVHRVLDGREDLLHHHSATLTPHFSEPSDNNRLSLSSRPLAIRLAELGFTKSSKTEIPAFVKQGDRETKIAYINGVWQMDGCITGSAKHHVRSIELGSIDRDFLEGMQKLLLEFGVYTRIFVSKKADSPALLPDGHGGLKAYNQKKSWSLRANSKADCQKLHYLVDWRSTSESKWQEIMANAFGSSWTQHRFRATVKSVEFAGIEDVYDPTVKDGHSIVYNGLVTGNCSEILQPQTHSEFNNAGEFDEVGRDIACNLGSLNVAKMQEADPETFEETVYDAIKFLSNVAEYGDFSSSPTVERGNTAARAIGLGQMNLHGYLIERGVPYDSEEAVKIWRDYIRKVTYYSILTSTDLAEERGACESFDGSDWQNGAVIKRIIDDLHKHPSDDKFGNQETWEDLQKRIDTYGMYNQHLQAIPPTGSISYINNSTSSIHPIAAKIEIRKEGKLGRVYYPAYGLTNENFSEVKTAYDMSPNAIIDMYAASTPYVDQGQSLTLFFRDTATTRDLNRAQNYAHKSGVKTLYYIRIAQQALEGTEVSGCVSCML